MKTNLYQLLTAGVMILAGCSQTYYGTMETFGKHKRQLVTDHVLNVRDAQSSVSQKFTVALEQFQVSSTLRGVMLEEKYKELQNLYAACDSSTGKLESEIDKLNNVLDAMFEEWQGELEGYSDPQLRRASEDRLNRTMARYDKLVMGFERGTENIYPALKAYKDQLLFVKHNLNAQADGSVKQEFGKFQSQITSLLRQLDASMAECDSFIALIQAE